MHSVALLWLFPLGFVAAGIAFIRAAVRGRRRSAHFEATAAQAPGEVVDLRWELHRNIDEQRRLAFPILRFALPDGRTVETKASFGSNPPPAKPGDQVTVFYDAENPTNASLKAGAANAAMYGVMFGLGVVFIAGGLAAGAVMALVAGSVDGL